MLDLEDMIQQSALFLEMNQSQLIDFLHMTNYKLEQLLSNEATYSYDVYRALLILAHNFNVVVDSDYLSKKSSFSFFRKKLSSYYETGGNRDILPYLIGIDSWEQEFSKVIISGKQKFVVNTFYSGYQGIPDQLKYFCEVPDFYPAITSELKAKIYKKKDS